MTFDQGWASECSEYIESTDDFRQFITEVALACWDASDQTTETLTGLIGSIEAAKQVLFMHLGDRFNDE